MLKLLEGLIGCWGKRWKILFDFLLSKEKKEETFSPFSFLSENQHFRQQVTCFIDEFSELQVWSQECFCLPFERHCGSAETGPT